MKKITGIIVGLVGAMLMGSCFGGGGMQQGGEVVGVSVRKDLLDEKDALHLEKANLVAYSHGLYHKLGDVMGFFGWSVARPEVYEKRMSALR